MNNPNIRNESGFTLMELMIASAIFLVVMSAVFGVLQIANISRDSINASAETLNNARFSINSAGRDALNAGLGYSRVGGIVPDDVGSTLLNLPADTGTARDVFTAVLSGDNVTTSTLSLPGEQNDVVGFMYRDLAFNGGNPVVITSVAYNSNRIDLSTSAGACASCRLYDLYLVESGNGNHALALATDIRNSNSMIRVETGDPLGINRRTNLPVLERSILTPCVGAETANCFNYAPQGTVKRVFLISYGVNADGVLVRKTYGNNTGGLATEQIQEVPLAYGVQSFQVKYLLQDGTYTDNPSNNGNNQGLMNEVIQVVMSITIKPDRENTQITSTQLIYLVSTFSTRNLKYDVE